MQREPVSSTSLASVGYDSESDRLEIEFVQGAVYEYFAVPPTIHQSLIEADSIGGYFAANIKGKYDFKKL